MKIEPTGDSGEPSAPDCADTTARSGASRSARHGNGSSTAGLDLVMGFDSWDWSGLTFRAVAQRAGVGERTVYRHFPTERALHDAIMGQLTERGRRRLPAPHPRRRRRHLRRGSSVRWERSPSKTSRLRRTTRPSSPPTRSDGRPCCGRCSLARPELSPERATAGWPPRWTSSGGCRPTTGCVSAWGMDSEEAVAAIGWVIETLIGAADAESAPLTE